MIRAIYQAVKDTNNVYYFDIRSTFSSEYTIAYRRHFVRNDIHLTRQGARLLSELVANNIALVNQWWK